MVAADRHMTRRSKRGKRLRRELVDLIREKLAGRLTQVEFEARVAEATLPGGVLSESDFTDDAIDRLRQRRFDFGDPQADPEPACQAGARSAPRVS